MGRELEGEEANTKERGRERGTPMVGCGWIYVGRWIGRSQKCGKRGANIRSEPSE